MSKWMFAALLLLQAHFATSYIVPLDSEAREEFGGLLRWVWPWEVGDSGPLGEITETSVPIGGFFLAVTAASLLLLAALAVVGLWIPSSWWRVLAAGGAVVSLGLMVLFFGPTKLLPIAAALIALWITITNWASSSWSAVPAE
jgi:hypothetical protein